MENVLFLSFHEMKIFAEETTGYFSNQHPTPTTFFPSQNGRGLIPVWLVRDNLCKNSGDFFFFASKARVSRREQKVSVIRRNENARQWETVPGSRVPVVVCTARAICISTAKFDYVDDDEVGDIKCFPLFSFSLEHRRGREKGKDVHIHIHIHVSTSLRFVHLNLKFVSKFSYYFFRSPFCIYIYICAAKILLYESKEDFEKSR